MGTAHSKGHKEALRGKETVFQAKCKKQKGKDLKMLCSGMIRNAMCLRLQRRWSKLISILLLSKIFIDEKRKELGKFIMNNF